MHTSTLLILSCTHYVAVILKDFQLSIDYIHSHIHYQLSCITNSNNSFLQMPIKLWGLALWSNMGADAPGIRDWKHGPKELLISAPTTACPWCGLVFVFFANLLGRSIHKLYSSKLQNSLWLEVDPKIEQCLVQLYVTWIAIDVPQKMAQWVPVP